MDLINRLIMKNIYLFDEHKSSKKNGIGPFIKAYIACLEKIGSNISLISFNENIPEFDIKTENGIRKLLFPVFPTKNFPAHYRIIHRFLKLYIQDSPDNIFCFNHSPCKDLLRVVKDSFPLSKLVFTIHDMGWTVVLNGDSVKLEYIVAHRNRKTIEEKNRYVLKYFDQEKQMYDIVDAVVCLSESTYDILKNIYEVDKDKIHLIPSGLKRNRVSMSLQEKAVIREEWHIEDNEKILLYAGRLSEAKGVYALISAFAGILETHPRVRLVLAGAANGEWDEFFASVKNISSKIIVTGFISKKELEKWYCIADIGIIPSYYEQCPYVAIEMMMRGLPLVVSDANGLKSMFKDNKNAKVARIGNKLDKREFSHNISVAVSKLLTSEKSRGMLGDGAKHTFESNYSLLPMCRRYQHFLQKIGSD